MSQNNNSIRYVYELPYKTWNEICDLLDMNDEWKELGGSLMDYSICTLHKFMKEKSPTYALLLDWGNQNHKIKELFILLCKMKHYRAMSILKPYVKGKYHYMIQESDDTTSINKPSEGNKSKENVADPSIRSEIRKTTEKKLPDTNEVDAGIPAVAYKELELATNNWNTKKILGKGGFGVVYKGIWKETLVAVKRLKLQKGDESEKYQTLRELKYLNCSRHDNILPLYGYSIEKDKCCLIYQYMPNGSLDDRLQCRNNGQPLNWNLRYKITTGTARGLQFLHEINTPPLIHGDIKSANILLDSNFEPKIGDFGLVREGPGANYTHIKISRVHGTRPYLPVEFIHGKKFSTKVDTYSFGVVLFETATGLRAFDGTRSDKLLRDYIMRYDEQNLHSLIDLKAGRENNNIFLLLMKLGKKCVDHNPKARPEMVDVFRFLTDYMEYISTFDPNLRRSPVHLTSGVPEITVQCPSHVNNLKNPSVLPDSKKVQDGSIPKNKMNVSIKEFNESLRILPIPDIKISENNQSSNQMIPETDIASILDIPEDVRKIFENSKNKDDVKL